jgi:hypothetical protein
MFSPRLLAYFSPDPPSSVPITAASLLAATFSGQGRRVAQRTLLSLDLDMVT